MDSLDRGENASVRGLAAGESAMLAMYCLASSGSEMRESRERKYGRFSGSVAESIWDEAGGRWLAGALVDADESGEGWMLDIDGFACRWRENALSLGAGEAVVGGMDAVWYCCWEGVVGSPPTPNV